MGLLNIKKEDVSINPDGSIILNNPVLKAQVEKIATTEPESIMKEELAHTIINNGCRQVEKIATTEPESMMKEELAHTIINNGC